MTCRNFAFLSLPHFHSLCVCVYVFVSCWFHFDLIPFCCTDPTSSLINTLKNRAYNSIEKGPPTHHSRLMLSALEHLTGLQLGSFSFFERSLAKPLTMKGICGTEILQGQNLLVFNVSVALYSSSESAHESPCLGVAPGVPRRQIKSLRGAVAGHDWVRGAPRGGKRANFALPGMQTKQSLHELLVSSRTWCHSLGYYSIKGTNEQRIKNISNPAHHPIIKRSLEELPWHEKWSRSC